MSSQILPPVDGEVNAQADAGAVVAGLTNEQFDVATVLPTLRSGPANSPVTGPAADAPPPTASAESASPSTATVGTVAMVIRGIHQPRRFGRQMPTAPAREAMRAAINVLDYSAAEPVVEWVGTDAMAVLDVDYHESPLNSRPSEQQLDMLIRQVRPQPSFWWRSHGRGLHAVFIATEGYTAGELAAVAALSMRGLDPTCTVEIKSETRHPRYPCPDFPSAGQVFENESEVDLADLRRLLGRQADEGSVEEWLGENGLERGRRYGHEHCPCDPGTDGHGEPVVVGDTGVSCHRCEAHGLSLGGGQAGFFSFAKLVGGGISSLVLNAVANFTHWEHAATIMECEVGLVRKVAELVFKAALKLRHGADDLRIAEVFHRGRGLVRAAGYWATPELSQAHAKDGLKDRLGALPAVKFIETDNDGNKKLQVDTEKLGIFRGVDDLSPYGYPAIVPVRGMRVGSHFIEQPNRKQISKIYLTRAKVGRFS